MLLLVMTIKHRYIYNCGIHMVYLIHVYAHSIRIQFPCTIIYAMIVLSINNQDLNNCIACLRPWSITIFWSSTHTQKEHSDQGLLYLSFI